MDNAGTRGAFKSALLAATCLMAASAAAQDTSVENRLDRLEALVEGLVQRLDAQSGDMTCSKRKSLRRPSRRWRNHAHCRRSNSSSQSALKRPKGIQERRLPSWQDHRIL